LKQFPDEARDGDDRALRRCQVEAMIAMGRIHAVVETRVRELFEAEGLDDITPAQSNALMVMFQARKPLTARELAAKLGVSEVTVSRFVKVLIGKQWVGRRRDPDDGRAWLLEPTARAREALPQFIRVSNALLDGAFGGFSRAEVVAFEQALQRLTANLRDEG
jgi:DNA-binding MarR family transcriptional regulator